jgi:hypothetical protein
MAIEMLDYTYLNHAPNARCCVGWRFEQETQVVFVWWRARRLPECAGRAMTKRS